MADYKGIKGFKVESLASDPSNVLNGEVWYNTTSAALKLGSQGSPGWSSGGNLNTARQDGGAAGSQTACLCIGGYTGTAALDIVEQYDGSTWTELSADLNTAKYIAGTVGTTTNALAFGGNYPPPGSTETESWNGSTWTEVGDLNHGRWSGSSLGSANTAAVYAGGQSAPAPIPKDLSETWNGTAWTEGNNLNTARFSVTGAGSTTAGIIAGGNVNPPTDYVAWVETYDGTCWTETTDIPTGDAGMGSASQGTTTAAFFFGGTLPGPGTGGLFWNGSAWTTSPAMATPRTSNMQQGGTSTAALAFGANPAVVTTEEYSDPAPIDTKTVTIS